MNRASSAYFHSTAAARNKIRNPLDISTASVPSSMLFSCCITSTPNETGACPKQEHSRLYCIILYYDACGIYRLEKTKSRTWKLNWRHHSLALFIWSSLQEHQPYGITEKLLEISYQWHLLSPFNFTQALCKKKLHTGNCKRIHDGLDLLVVHPVSWHGDIHGGDAPEQQALDQQLPDLYHCDEASTAHLTGYSEGDPVNSNQFKTLSPKQKVLVCSI